MKGAFRKISRAASLTGGTKWYLSADCLLAAKRVMYAVEYRRFYLRDLEYIMVWPSRLWLWRLILPAVLLAALGAVLWQRVNSTAGAILGSLALLWVAWELTLGPTARSRIRITGASVDLPLVNRIRRARKILARIDAAVVATRTALEQPTAHQTINQGAELPVETRSEASSTPSVTAAIQTNGF